MSEQETSAPVANAISYGDSVIIYGSPTTIQLVTLLEEGSFGNKFGTYKHSFFVGRQFGDKVNSVNNKGYVYVLRLTPQLFTETLTHATQILYSADIGMVLFRLDVGRGDIVCESGTGSSSMTYALATAVGTTGSVFTYEYNVERFEASRSLFKALRLPQVFHFHRNVLAEGFACEELKQTLPKAVFLDLPKPEQAVPFASAILRRGGRLCTFSPCIEQVQATVQALATCGFLCVETVEVVERTVQTKYAPGQNASEKKENVFISGEAKGKTHTGFLTFATKFID